MAVHQHNERAAADKIVALLKAGQSVAFASDAGTPAVSDPGALLVQAVRAAGLRVIPVPGANAAIAALSAAGMNVCTSTPGGLRKVRSRSPSSGIAAQRLSAVCREPTSTARAGTRHSLAYGAKRL